MNSQNRVKLQVWLLIVIVFVLGGVTGAALDRAFVRLGSEKSEGRRGWGRELRIMKSDLNLTDDQEKSIRAIFDENRKEFRARMAECPGYKEMRTRTDARIKEVLTPEQRIQYDQLKARREAEKNHK